MAKAGGSGAKPPPRPNLALFLSLARFAPGAPPFVQTYWTKVMSSASIEQLRATQTALETPDPSMAKRHGVPEPVIEELQRLVDRGMVKIVVALLSGAKAAREHYEAFGRPDHERRTVAARLRVAARWPKSCKTSAVEKDREQLQSMRIRDRNLLATLVGSKSRRGKPWRNFCAAAIVLVLRSETGKPHYGLVARLMLRAGVLGDSQDSKWCRPWDLMIDSSTRCKDYRKTGRVCPRPCARAEALARQLVHLAYPGLRP